METILYIKVGIVLYVSTNVDDPLEFYKTAELAVKYKDKGVCGFGGIKKYFMKIIIYFLKYLEIMTFLPILTNILKVHLII